MQTCIYYAVINGISRGKIYYILNKMKRKQGLRLLTIRRNIAIGRINCQMLRLKQLEITLNHLKVERVTTAKKTDKQYLTDAFNVSKMFEMFKTFQQENKSGIVCSLQSHRTIFNNEFNISFGYPRTDTCSTCDQYVAKKIP